ISPIPSDGNAVIQSGPRLEFIIVEFLESPLSGPQAQWEAFHRTKGCRSVFSSPPSKSLTTHYGGIASGKASCPRVQSLASSLFPGRVARTADRESRFSPNR